MKTATTKTCTKCGEEKELTEYYVRANKVDAQCKVCILAKNTVWREANRELKQKRNREWWAENREEIAERRRKAYHANPEHYRRVKREHRANNPEKYKEYNRQYRLRNPEKLKAKNAEYYQANKERHAERNREYLKNNPEQLRATNNRAKAKRRSAETDNHTLAELHEYWRANGIDPKRCTYCNAWHTKWANNWKTAVGDHVIPLAKGGKDVLENLMPCCRSCNCSKGAKILGEEWIPPKDR
tara:strand:- start:444 stop:1169 length:726 start_codon:yes stop_codon:yes gene_type:complete